MARELEHECKEPSNDERESGRDRGIARERERPSGGAT